MKVNKEHIKEIEQSSKDKREHFRNLIRTSSINEQSYTEEQKLIQNEAFWDGVNTAMGMIFDK